MGNEILDQVLKTVSKNEPAEETAEQIEAKRVADETAAKVEADRIKNEQIEADKKKTPPAPVSKKLKEVFDIDDYKDKEDEDIINDVKQTKTKHKELETNYQKLQESLKSIESPFDSEMEHKAFLLKKQNPAISMDIALKLVNADEIAKLDSTEAIILKAMIDDPDTKPEIERKVLKKDFDLTPLTDKQKEEMEPEDIEEYNDELIIRQAKLDKLGKASKKELVEMAGKVQLPNLISAKDKQEGYQKFVTTITDGWTKVSEAAVKDMKTIDVTVEIGEGKTETIKVDVPEDVRTQIKESAIKAMVANNFAKFDETEGKILHSYIQNAAQLVSQQQINKVIWEKAFNAGIASKNNAGNPGGDKNIHTGSDGNEGDGLKERQQAVSSILSKRG